MERLRRANPIAFRTWPVTIVISLVYIALFAALLYTHHIVPSAPRGAHPDVGVNLTDAWADLQHLTSKFHPYNSHENDNVRSWLIERIKSIFVANGVKYKYVHPQTVDALPAVADLQNDEEGASLFDDTVSNASFALTPSGSTSVYFEGSNIIVYIKGTRKVSAQTFQSNDQPPSEPHNCVLVNAHFDSVSTGFGATDDGVGVVSILQLINHFTSFGQRPRRCLVFLLNDGEEDFLNGARAFAKHPLSDHVNVFMNLEGAGAGGRAAMFRSTDADITKMYRKSPYPFGTAASQDGFHQGLVRSQTDFLIFHDDLDYRGIDVAFIEPRSRYHTSSDSAKETNIASMWHMLSAALATTTSMVSFPQTDWHDYKGSESVYFDLFGRAFGAMSLTVLIDASAALLVVGPVLLVVISFLLVSRDKWYILAGTTRPKLLPPGLQDDSQITVELQGRRGFFRTPAALILATAAVVALALLTSNVNPFIVYSSPYALWSMLLATFFLITWVVFTLADRIRPTALQRLYVTFWLYLLTWLLLAVSLAAEVNLRLCGAYAFLILNASTFLALTTNFLELLHLPAKHSYATHASAAGGPEQPPSDDDDNNDETSPLLARPRRAFSSHTTRLTALLTHPWLAPEAKSQPWSMHLPSSLWVLQLFLLAPINIIFIAQLGLFLTSALYQTPADGSPVGLIYISIALFSGLLVLPVVPFMHRISGRFALVLALVAVGTAVYNLVAFPFSAQNRVKLYFSQAVEVPTGVERVRMTGVAPFVQNVVKALPSARGFSCYSTGQIKGLTTCEWASGLIPDVDPVRNVSDWVGVQTRRTGRGGAVIRVRGANTRACRLFFDDAVMDYNITGADEASAPFMKVPEQGVKELRLWAREWGREWEVSVSWGGSEDERVQSNGDSGMMIGKGRYTGRAVCLWSDANDVATIPALTEVKRYMPVWSTVTKAGDGLVEGSLDFTV